MIVKKQFTSQVSNNDRRSQFWVKGIRAGDSPFEEKALAVFQPDILVSSQYLATYRRKFHLDPERLLMVAVLEDAIVCFQDNIAATCNRQRALYRDAEEWILDNGYSYLFSFENVCEALDYDAAYLRQGLMRWKERALARLCERAGRQGVVGNKRQLYRGIAENHADHAENGGSL